MPKFGKYGLVGITKHEFEKEPQWYWNIKAVTSGMELDNSKFLSHRRLVAGSDGGRTELPPTVMEVAFHEIALCFGSTNIPMDEDKPVEDGGAPIIAEGESVDSIKEKLRMFPRDILMEIWKAIGETYPYWGPIDPNSI